MKLKISLLFFFYFVKLTTAQNIDSLMQVYNRTKSDTLKCFILYEIAKKSSENRELYGSKLLSQSEIFLKKFNSDKEKQLIFLRYYANALNIKGYLFRNKGNIDSALIYYNKSLVIRSKIFDSIGMAKSIENIGILYTNIFQFDSAISFFNRSLNIRKNINDVQGIANTLSSIAVIYSSRGDTKMSLDYNMKSLNIYNSINDFQGSANVLHNIGGIYSSANEIEKAISSYQKSSYFFSKINDKIGYSNNLMSIGVLQLNQKNDNDGLKNLELCKKIKQEIGDVQGTAMAMAAIGGKYFKDEKYDVALHYLDSAKLMSEQIRDFKNLANVLSIVGELYIKTGNFNKAEDALKRAYNLLKEQNSLTDLQLNVHLLYKLYTMKSNDKQALFFLTEYYKLKDSLNNDINKKAILKSQYQIEYQTKALADSLKTNEEKKITKLQLKQEETIRYALYSGLALVLLFSIFMVNRFQVTKKQKQIIELKEKETQRQNEIITIQKHLVEEKHKEISDSINYAERIQRSFLATKEILDSNLPDYFILFKPKDVVSGDFYWSGTIQEPKGCNKFVLVTADSTGHGVPGAIMSLLNITSLEKAIETHKNPADILNATRETIIDRLKKDGSADGGKDGMDCSLLCFDFENGKLCIAAANNPVWITRSSEIGVLETTMIEIKPDKMPVGKHDKQDQSFTQQEIDLRKGDVIYTLTDGYPDQFGGERGKKFMSKNLKELLLKNTGLPMHQQKVILESTLKDWMGGAEQIDDITLIGIKI